MVRATFMEHTNWMAPLLAALVVMTMAPLSLEAQAQTAPLRKAPSARPKTPWPRALPKPLPGPPGRQNMVDHLMSLPPEQQQQFMRNNPRFRSLPPLQQQRIQQRLEQFNSLPPARQQALRERYELFRQLPPEQQNEARSLYRQWNQYPPDRRRALLQGFRRLRDTPPDQRQETMDSEEFRNRFNDGEQQTLRGLVNLLPGE
jgi:hypothetical protein